MVLIIKNTIAWFFLVYMAVCQAQDDEPDEKRNSFTVQIKANPKKEDAYCSTRMNVPEWALGRTVIGFEPLPGFAAHHMILYMCENQPLWTNVDQREDQCDESESVMRLCGNIQFVWANGGLPLYLPPHVGLKLGNSRGQVSFALQVHFGSTAKTWSDRSGVRLILTEEDRQWDKPEVWLLVPYSFPKLSPGQAQVVIGDREKRRASFDLMVFAVRVHSHHRGIWNEVSVHRDGKEVWRYRRSTGLPQSFIPLPEHVYIKKDDEVRFKCAYDTSNEVEATAEGATRHEEMCNVYLMYYRLPGVDATEESTSSRVLPRTHLRKVEDCVSSTVSAVPVTSQIVGVSASNTGKDHLYVFHRGNTIWSARSFTFKDVFTGTKISTDVIMRLDANSLQTLDSMGANQFYMPHSIKVDPENENIVWLCDVGAHQVIEYDVTLKRPKRKLGMELTPGRSPQHFCKPTDIALSSDNKLLYITDGYCNSRIIVFNKKDLTFVREMGTDLFVVPHAIHVLRCGGSGNSDLLVVADRENGRVQILNSKDGRVLQNIQSWGPGLYPYSIAVDPMSSRLFAGLIQRGFKSKGSIWMSNHGICDLPTGATLEGDSICDADHNGFEEPHMITLFGRKLFVAESGGGKLHGRLAQVSF